MIQTNVPNSKTPNIAPRIPADIASLLLWSDVIRRLISVSNNGGHSIISLKIVVNGDGKPIQWTEPSVKRLEPKRDAEETLAEILKLLTCD